MSVNEWLTQAAQLETQRKSTEAGAILIDAVDAVAQSGEFPDGIGLIFLRIGLNFLGTDLEVNGIESIGDGLAQINFDSKILKKSLDQLARFLFDAVLQLGQAGKLEVAQNVMKAAFPLIEKVKFKDAEVLTPIITQAVLSTFTGKIPEAQKFATAATEINQKVKSAPVSLLLQLISMIVAYQNKDYASFLDGANKLLEESAKQENYYVIALIAEIMAKAFTSAGKGNEAYSWWATAEAAASTANLKKLQVYARERKQELQRIIAAKAAAAEAKKAEQPAGPIIPKSPFGDSFTPAPTFRAPVAITPPPEPPIPSEPTPVPIVPASTPSAPSEGGSRKDELFHQIESVKALIKDIDDALPTAQDPGALRQQKSLMRKKLRELQEEHDKSP